MGPTSWKQGHRVVVSDLAETPLEAVEKHMTLEPMDPPDPATLSKRDVLIAVESASVGWVDLLMTSGRARASTWSTTASAETSRSRASAA